MTRIAILPYRKMGFAREFGFTVRDLMILQILAQLPEIERIDWFERPGLPHEYFRDKIMGIPATNAKIHIHENLDLGLIGALRHRRAWTDQSMKRLETSLKIWCDESQDRPILLDFNPFYCPPTDLVKRCFYWYDLIDTFTKHNRFSDTEKAAVARKYEFVKEHANLVTGVTHAAVKPFNGEVLANRLLRDTLGETSGSQEYDLGFLGFITNKFDMDAVRTFAAQGLKILICGHAYDPKVVKALQEIENLTYYGAFKSEDVPRLISKFRVGMVPYRMQLSHDESPIKFFQYIAYGRPAILSAHFNTIENQFPEAVHYYDASQPEGVSAFVKNWKNDFENRSVQLSEKARANSELFWDKAISDLIGRIEK